jgi:hypothetical protein
VRWLPTGGLAVCGGTLLTAMPLPVISNVVRAAVRGTCPSGQRWINVLHFHWTGAGSPIANIAALHTQVLKLYTGPAYAGGLGAGLALNNSSVPQTCDDVTYTPLDGSTASAVVNVGVAATGAVQMQPSEVAMVTTLRSLTRGRSFRGRVYLPPKDTGVITSVGVISPAIITAYLAQWNGFNAAAGAANWTHVIASYKLAIGTAVQSYTMDNKFDVQRGRK